MLETLLNPFTTKGRSSALPCHHDYSSSVSPTRRCKYSFDPATTSSLPFSITVHSDPTEVQAETGVAGFKLDYTQVAC